MNPSLTVYQGMKRKHQLRDFSALRQPAGQEQLAQIGEDEQIVHASVTCMEEGWACVPVPRWGATGRFY